MKVIYLGMPSKEGRQSKILKKNGVSSFDSKKNAGIFSRFFSLLQNLLHKKNKFGIETNGEYNKQIYNKCEDFVLLSIDVTSVEKIFKFKELKYCQGLQN